MGYGWNIDKDESLTFGSLSRDFYYASLLIDEIVAENVREVWRLLKVHQARADVVVPERGAAALHVLAGLEAEEFAATVTVRVLRKSRADPNVRSEEGLTPTHVAATYGRCRVLEVLLTNRADPSLLDYRLLLDAKDHAYKERQWQAFTLLTTYSAILENEERLHEYMDSKDDFLSDQRSRADFSLNSCTDEAFLDTRTVSNSKLYGEGNGSEKEVSSWFKNSLEVIPLNEKAQNIIKTHRNNEETYHFPAAQDERPFHSLDHRHSVISESELGEKKEFTTKHYLEDRLLGRSLSPLGAEKKVSKRNCIDPKVNSLRSRNGDLNLKAKSTSTHQSRNEHEVDLIKNSPNGSKDESEVYYYGYAESSGSYLEAAGSSCHKSDIDHSKTLNSYMLSKMSRIFLYILKKRHSPYRQL